MSLLAISVGPDSSNNTLTRHLLTEWFDTQSILDLGLGAALATAPKQAANFSAYNAALRSIRPWIIVRVGNATTTDPDGHADVQVVCARAKDVKAGSRVPDASSTGTITGAGARWIMWLAVFIVTAVVTQGLQKMIVHANAVCEQQPGSDSRHMGTKE